VQHNLRLAGHRFDLRPAYIDDAAFILGLRRDPELSRFLHPTSPRLQDQIDWMVAYEARAGDYYFIVEDQADGTPVGAVGLYDVVDRAGEWGRWLISPGVLAAVESALLIYRLGFEALDLREVYCRTLAGNRQVLSFHDSMGAERRRTLSAYAHLADGDHDAVEHVVTREAWPTLRPRLERLAQRVAGVRLV